MRYRKTILTIGWLALLSPKTHADQVAFAYEGDVVPSDPSSGFPAFNPCDGACSQSVQNGILTFQWQGPGILDRQTGFAHNFGPYPSDPPPLPFWVEWRFASNLPLGPFFYDLDGAMVIASDPIFMHLNMYGNGIVNQDASEFVTHLELNAFRTYRLELDGLNYCVWYDGNLFTCAAGDFNAPGVHYLQIQGNGGDDPNFSWPLINRWDYIRYGQMTTGELLVSSDPPSGVLDAAQYPSLDRFTITYDQPNYVHLDEVKVQVSSGSPPQVIKTRRQDNGPAETVEIVLDRPLQVGVTTIFTFDTGLGALGPNIVTYTLVQMGTCCQADGACTHSTEVECAAVQGSFTPGASCAPLSACCLTGGPCQNLAAVCCSALGGTPNSSGLCEGDADHDGLDGLCGDACPNDPDNDIDHDGLCGDLDPCPDLNPNDANGNSIPDCQESPVIPTVTHWGLAILTLALLCTSKARSLSRTDALAK